MVNRLMISKVMKQLKMLLFAVNSILFPFLKKLRFFIFLLGISFIINSCSSYHEKEINFSLDAPENYFLIIKNEGVKNAEFNLVINEKDFINTDNVIKFIQSMPNEFENESFEIKAFRFVRDYTWHDNDICNVNWFYNPYIFINSVGGGLCGIRAYTLNNIFLSAGYDSRVLDFD